jgi:thiaminase/transcriptional activator TenA
MFRDELGEIRDLVLPQVLDHPFWSGLRDGSLPGAALRHFVEQDTGFLLPAYARALARCASLAADDTDAWLLAASAAASLEARDRLRAAYAELASGLGLPPLDQRAAEGPATNAHASFFMAASATSFHAGAGALLPMVWFNDAVTQSLVRGAAPGSRYRPWIEVYHPGADYQQAVQGFSTMVERAGRSASVRERADLIGQFRTGVRYEWLFAEACWRPAAWPDETSGPGEPGEPGVGAAEIPAAREGSLR